MHLISAEKREMLLDCFKNRKISLRRISRDYEINLRTVRRYHRLYLDEEIAIRIAKEKKESSLIKVNKKAEKVIQITEAFDRSKKPNWIRYMLSNPSYFEYATGIKFSENAVKEEAEKEFEMGICECCGSYKPKIKCLSKALDLASFEISNPFEDAHRVIL